MGKSRRSRRRDSFSFANEVAPSYRRVPYGRVSKKKFSALRAADSRNLRFGRNQKRSVYGRVKSHVRVLGSQYSKYRTTPKSTHLWALSTTVGIPQVHEVVRKVRSKILSVCERRSQRKEVLHAIKKTGKVGQKTPIWTKLSRKKCK